MNRRRRRNGRRGRVWAARCFWIGLLALAARDLLSRLGTEPPAEAIRGITSFWMLPAIVAAFVLYGWVRRVRVYDALVEGAKQGFDVALRIIPYLVAILVAVGMFRAAGGVDALVTVLGPITTLIGLPARCCRWRCFGHSADRVRWEWHRKH